MPIRAGSTPADVRRLRDRLAADGVHVARIGVRSPEMPEELERRADVVVDGPQGALDLLRALLL